MNNNKHLRFKDEHGNDFLDWEEKSIIDVGEIVGGGTPDTMNEDYWNGDVEWFTPTEIKSKFIESSLRKLTDRGLKNSSAKILPQGSLLLTSRATIGEVGIAIRSCATNQGFQSIVVDKKNNNEFIYYSLCLLKKEMVKRSSGSTFPEISKTELSKIIINLPSLQEQEKIAQFLSAIDEKIEMIKQKITETKKYKKGLMQQMFAEQEV